MIITLAGGGSTFTPGIVKSIALRKDELEVDEIRLYDINEERQRKVGVLVEVNCETDFVARGDQFKELVHDIALQIAAAKPLYVTKEEVPAEVLEEEKKILKVQAMNEGKPEAIAEKMVAGRIKKYYEDFCLLEQPFVKDSSKTINQLITEAIAAIGEKITVRRFARFEMGEGIEKRKDDLAEEVEKQVSKMKG